MNFKAKMFNRKASDPKNKPNQVLETLVLQSRQKVAACMQRLPILKIASARTQSETIFRRGSHKYSRFEMSTKKEKVDLELHITAKNLAILQGKIAFILNELVKKAKLLHLKEEANNLLRMISDNLN